MSLVFSDPENESGIIELIDDKCGSSPDSYPTKKKTVNVNLGASRLFFLALKAAGKWQVDDSNHLKSPIISTDLIAGQRDYSFLQDEEGAFVLDIFKVMVADTKQFFREARPVDVQSEHNTENFYNGQEVQAIPYRYDKTGNSLFLDPIPSYNMRLVEEGVAGLKMYVNREQVYFVPTDTDKVLGFAHMFHEYLPLYAAWKYASKNTLTVAASLGAEVVAMEGDIAEYFGNRAKDERPRMRARITRFK